MTRVKMPKRIDPQYFLIINATCDGETHRWALRKSQTIVNQANAIWDVHHHPQQRGSQQFTLATPEGMMHTPTLLTGTALSEGDTVVVVPLPPTEEG